MAQMKGKVKWFDVKKGYGYIEDQNGNDFFAHFTGITEGRTYVGLKDGDEVTFDVVPGKKGEQAGNIHLTSPVRRAPKATTESTTEATEVTE